jgi:hypothetical protein
MDHPDDKASAPDLPPDLWRRLKEVEQLLRESGNPDPDQPDSCQPDEDNATRQLGRISRCSNSPGTDDKVR